MEYTSESLSELIFQVINNILTKLFASLDKTIYSLLDNITFIDENILEQEKLSYKIYEKDTLLEEHKGIAKAYNNMLKTSLTKLEMENRLNRLQDKLDNFSLDDLEKVVEGIESATL